MLRFSLLLQTTEIPKEKKVPIRFKEQNKRIRTKKGGVTGKMALGRSVIKRQELSHLDRTSANACDAKKANKSSRICPSHTLLMWSLARQLSLALVDPQPVGELVIGRTRSSLLLFAHTFIVSSEFPHPSPSHLSRSIPFQHSVLLLDKRNCAPPPTSLPHHHPQCRCKTWSWVWALS